MKIDVTHRSWGIATIVIFALCTAGYLAYASRTSGGPRGDTVIGLLYGIAGAAMLLFTGGLALRKKLLRVRVGSVTWWMRGHLWLGTLSLPLALFHAAFSFGGLLTTVLMWLMIVVVVSGLLGAALQHCMPEVVTSQVSEEHTYENIERRRIDLRAEAYGIVAKVCESMNDSELETERGELSKSIGVDPCPKAAEIKPIEGHSTLKEAYVAAFLPFFRGAAANGSPLLSRTMAESYFDHLRLQLSAGLLPGLDELIRISRLMRQMADQVRLHRVLHGWLLVHIPASMALLVLMVIHAVSALYY